MTARNGNLFRQTGNRSLLDNKKESLLSDFAFLALIRTLKSRLPPECSVAIAVGFPSVYLLSFRHSHATSALQFRSRNPNISAYSCLSPSHLPFKEDIARDAAIAMRVQSIVYTAFDLQAQLANGTCCISMREVIRTGTAETVD